MMVNFFCITRRVEQFISSDHRITMFYSKIFFNKTLNDRDFKNVNESKVLALKMGPSKNMVN